VTATGIPTGADGSLELLERQVGRPLAECTVGQHLQSFEHVVRCGVWVVDLDDFPR